MSNKKKVELNSWYDVDVADKGNSTSRILVVPDSHWPNADKRAWGVMIRAAEYLQPTHIVVLGDFIDCGSVSVHEKEKNQPSIRDEAKAGNLALDQLDSLGAKSKMYIFGNHERRVQVFINKNCPELDGYVTVEDLLKLKERGWGVTPYKDFYQIGRSFYTHDDANAGAMAHLKARDTYESNICIGHTHRLASHFSSSMKGTPKVGIMCGWLGSTKNVSYMHRSKLRYWQHGFVTGLMENRSGNVHFSLHPIIDYKVNINGRIIK